MNCCNYYSYNCYNCYNYYRIQHMSLLKHVIHSNWFYLFILYQ